MTEQDKVVSVPSASKAEPVISDYSMVISVQSNIKPQDLLESIKGSYKNKAISKDVAVKLLNYYISVCNKLKKEIRDE